MGLSLTRSPAGAAQLSELEARYNAVLLAYGCARDRTLGLPGEDLHGEDSGANLRLHPGARR
jgi:NADPH-dependent glutamate synthase beta subunit-like oxidoreductase